MFGRWIDAVGIRLRHLPFTPNKVLEAIEAKAAAQPAGSVR